MDAGGDDGKMDGEENEKRDAGETAADGDAKADDALTWWEKGMYQLYVKISTRNPKTGKSDFKWWERTKPMDAVDRDEFLRFTEHVMIDLQFSYALIGLVIDLYLLYVSYVRAATCPTLPNQPPLISISTYLSLFDSFTIYRWFIHPLLSIILFPLRWLLWLIIPSNTSPLALIGMCATRPPTSFLHLTYIIQYAYYAIHLTGRLWPDRLAGTLERFATLHLLYLVNGAVFLPLYLIPSDYINPNLSSVSIPRLNHTIESVTAELASGSPAVTRIMKGLQNYIVSAVAVTLSTTTISATVASEIVSLSLLTNRPACSSNSTSPTPCPSRSDDSLSLFHNPYSIPLLLNETFPPFINHTFTSSTPSPPKILRKTIRGSFWGSWILGGPRWGPIFCWWAFSVCHRVRWGVLHWELQQKIAVADETLKNAPPPEHEDEGHIVTGGRSGLCWRLGQVFSPVIVILVFWWGTAFLGGVNVGMRAGGGDVGNVTERVLELFPSAFDDLNAVNRSGLNETFGTVPPPALEDDERIALSDSPTIPIPDTFVPVIKSTLYWRTPDVPTQPSWFWMWMGVVVPAGCLTVWINFMSFQHRAVFWSEYGGGAWTKTRGIVVGDADGELKIGVIH
ncbi:hypothetical protein BC829DRAFT_282181 [Chytridium lagenaria]|nr:hypothetical protein BC829DRAFT_282181 [Chytridium lagenaria]